MNNLILVALGGSIGAVFRYLISIFMIQVFGSSFPLGALTTFSTFSNETLLLMQEGDWLKAALNVVLNLSLCLFMVYLGQQLVFSRI